MLTLKLPREQKELLIYDLQTYFSEELGESIGNLAAEGLLDYLLKQLGPLAYNQAIADARALIGEQMERIQDELYSLERPLDVRRQ